MSSGNFLFLLLMMLGPLVAASSSNWLICWVGIELSFLGLIPLLFMDNHQSSLSKESAMKYFCIQAAGSGVLLCGGIMLYMLPVELASVASFVFIVSLMVKLGIFPLHFWVPSVVSGLGWFSMFLLLTWQKVPPFLFMMNLLDNIPSLSEPVLVLAGLTAMVGAMIGLNQTKVSPMLGASSISHGGWALVGLVHGGLWIYFSLYCLVFLVLVWFLIVEDESLCSLGIISLSGLPPFLMFIGKWSVVSMSLFSGSLSYWYLVLPLTSSILSLFFYLKFFYSFYLEQESSLSVKSSMFVSLSVVSFFGVGFIYLF